MNKKLLLLLAFSHFSVDLYGSFLAPLQPFLVARHKLTLTQAGMLASLYSISASLLQPLYGYWSDRIGKRLFIIAAPLVAAVFMSMLPIVTSFWLMLTVLFLGGAGVASFHPQGSSMTHSLGGARKGIAMSLFISSGNFGSAIGPLCILYAVSRIGFESSYVAAVPGILLSLLLFVSLPNVPKPAARAPLRELIPRFRQSARPLGAVYVIVVFRTMVQLSFLTFVPLHLKATNHETIFIGWAVSAFLAGGATGGMLGGYLYDRIGGRNVFLLSSAIAPIFLLGSLYLESPALLVASYAVGGFFLMMTIPASVLIGQKLMPDAISTVSSLMMGFGWGVGGMMVPLAGRLADLTSIPETLAVLAVVPLLYLPFVWKLPDRASAEHESNIVTQA